MRSSLKKIALASAVIAVISFIGFFYTIYKEEQARVAYEKEEALKHVKIYSEQLEERAKFMNIKLGSPISAYKGFAPFDMLSSICLYANALTDENSHEQAWGYFSGDRKYSSIGRFQLGSHHYDIRKNKEKLTKSQGRESDSKIMVFTVNGIIYKIHADIEEASMGSMSSLDSFNYFLKNVYGPAINDNGHNDIYYNVNDDLTWESKNIILTTITNNRTDYVGNKMSGTTLVTHVEYIFKPLQNELNEIQSEVKQKETQEATDKL